MFSNTSQLDRELSFILGLVVIRAIASPCCSWMARNPPELHDPIRFPRLFGVVRISLFPARGCGCYVRPDEPHANWLPVKHTIGIESTDAVVETANDWRIQRAEWIAPVNPPNCPLCSLWIVRTHRDTAGN